MKKASPDVHILRIDCPDRKGLVHRVTGVLYRRGLNIISNGEFVDHENGRFFMRTEYSGRADAKRVLREVRALLPADSDVQLDAWRPKRIVLLATREAHCLGDLLLRHAYGELPADILAVISNHKELAPLAKRFGVRYHHVPVRGEDRDAQEAALSRLLVRCRPEYIVLAKYMRVLSPRFVQRWRGRIINIHHSFLPAFAGAHPYKQASERGVKIIGATAHFVNEELDRGPIIAQDVIPVDHSHSAADMALAGKDVEKRVLAKALKLAFEDRIFVSGNRTVIFD